MQIIAHYKESITWINRIRKIPEDIWRKQIAKGKWTIAEVIGHMIPWDEFVLHKRLPYLLTPLPLPKSPDVDWLNQQSSIESRNRPKEETIQLFIAVRKSLIGQLNDISDEVWTNEFLLGNQTISFYNYMSGLAEHDIHHFRQIQSTLEGGLCNI